MDFVAKHLPDPFYLEGALRVSLRSKIFREVVANLLVHREYMSAYPCTFIIKKGVLETENANNPHGDGPIDLQRFVPFPKNPTIVKFFLQLGRVEELGSGVVNINRYLEAYSGGGQPELIEGTTFKVRIPLPEYGGSETLNSKEIDERGTESDAVNDAVNDAVRKGVQKPTSDTVKNALVDIIKKTAVEIDGTSISQLMGSTGKSNAQVKRYIRILRAMDLIEYRGAPKTGGYFLTEKMKSKLPKL